MPTETSFTDHDPHREYAVALDVLRISKNAFLWLALAAIAFHLVTWATVKFANDRAAPMRGAPDEVQNDPNRIEGSFSMLSETQRWSRGQEMALAIAGFVARASLLVLTGIFVLALLVSLNGRLGGAAGLAKACVWTLAALAMVTPWVHVDLGPSLGSHGLFFGMNELTIRTRESGTMQQVLAIIRFVMSPLAVAMLLILAQLNFRKANERMSAPAMAKLPIHEV